jgi:chromosome segregation ATPase
MPKKENESPTLTAEKNAPAEDIPDIPPRERLEELEPRLVEYDGAIKETSSELERLRKSLRRMDADDSEEVEKLLDNLPESSPKGVIDKIYKMSRPQRTRLQESIGKMEISLQLLGKKVTLTRREIKQTERQMDDERFDDETREVCDLLTQWLNDFVKAEESFDKLTDMVPRTGDPRFFKRCTKLGYPKAFEVICDSHLSLSNINSMSMTELAERVAGLENAYGTPLLQKRMDRQQDIPLRRESFIEQHRMYGKV